MLANHKYFHWLYHTKSKNHLINWSTGLFIWLFLAITRPFGINNNDFEAYLHLVANLAVFGGVWVGISYITDLFASSKPKEIPKVDLAYLFAKLIIFIHIIFLIRQAVCDWKCFDAFEYLELWIACIIMLGIPYIIFSFYSRYLFFHSLVNKKSTPEGRIEIKGEGRETIEIALADLIFIKADDNYVDFEFQNGDRKLIRATLKKVQQQLRAYPHFVRTHRSYIANIHFASEFLRYDTLLINSNDDQIEIPVSKKYREFVKELFIHPK
ncbi:LytTR family transcriptional regulator DNA-binding domain-containing protein [Ekhidna sp.]|jgi:hypothetical protein|uniref:LytR/AlgR family response regulator transcription factor n=1 Tax=Ekhidna sp. TaxID=2608089 RepID=UPI0032EB1DBA